MESLSKKSRGTVSGTSSYYSKAAHVGLSTRGARMPGCFSWRTSVTGQTVFVQTSPGRRYPPPSRPVAGRTAYHTFPNSKVLWKLRSRKSSSSSLLLVTRPSLFLPSANSSPTRPAWISLYQRSSRRSIFARIYLALWAPRVLVRTTRSKTGISWNSNFDQAPLANMQPVLQ